MSTDPQQDNASFRKPDSIYRTEFHVFREKNLPELFRRLTAYFEYYSSDGSARYSVTNGVLLWDEVNREFAFSMGMRSEPGQLPFESITNRR